MQCPQHDVGGQVRVQVGPLRGEQRADVPMPERVDPVFPRTGFLVLRPGVRRGGPPGGPANSASTDEFLAAFNQHLVAAQVVLQAVLPGMKASGYGRIVNVISTSVKEPIRNLGVSNTVRWAVAGWAKTLAGELGALGITVNNVLPGYTQTQRLDQILADRMKATGKSGAEIEQAMLSTVPAGRFARPAEVASVIAFLATPAAAYVSGVNIPVDGGRTQSL